MGLRQQLRDSLCLPWIQHPHSLSLFRKTQKTVRFLSDGLPQGINRWPTEMSSRASMTCLSWAKELLELEVSCDGGLKTFSCLVTSTAVEQGQVKTTRHHTPVTRKAPICVLLGNQYHDFINPTAKHIWGISVSKDVSIQSYSAFIAMQHGQLEDSFAWLNLTLAKGRMQV